MKDWSVYYAEQRAGVYDDDTGEPCDDCGHYPCNCEECRTCDLHPCQCDDIYDRWKDREFDDL